MLLTTASFKTSDTRLKRWDWFGTPPRPILDSVSEQAPSGGDPISISALEYLLKNPC